MDTQSIISKLVRPIPTWEERCQHHPDHQQGMVTHAMIAARMQEEIDELREALEDLKQLYRTRRGFPTES